MFANRKLYQMSRVNLWKAVVWNSTIGLLPYIIAPLLLHGTYSINTMVRRAVEHEGPGQWSLWILQATPITSNISTESKYNFGNKPLSLSKLQCKSPTNHSSSQIYKEISFQSFYQTKNAESSQTSHCNKNCWLDTVSFLFYLGINKLNL